MTIDSRPPPAGLQPGGAQAKTPAPAAPAPKQVFTDLSDRLTNNKFAFSSASGRSTTASSVKEQDWRVRITLPPQSKFAFNNPAGSGFMTYLKEQTNGISGVVFPYTPSITVTHNARYSEQALTHSNYKNYFYDGSDVAAISIAGVFTCQNGREALYLMSAIQFFRACTKMYFGTETAGASAPAGTPPTLVRLNGYGKHYLPGISCVVTSVSHVMPEDVDYIQYIYQNEKGWMPTQSTLTVTLQPVISRRRQSQSIALDDYVQGRLTKSSDNQGGII